MTTLLASPPVRPSDHVSALCVDSQAQFDRTADRLGLDRPTQTRVYACALSSREQTGRQPPAPTRDLPSAASLWFRTSSPTPVAMLDECMANAYALVATTANRERLPLRDAAYAVGIGRVAEACKLRGWV